ncbi:hypothetical protein GCM10008019_02140 [Deinococcus soli (ex Cha et al. 2016)]|nr:hypothetical protein GCM10008019_02140 [Deinococcus soli (ex Cha et al. 2016)]
MRAQQVIGADQIRRDQFLQVPVIQRKRFIHEGQSSRAPRRPPNPEQNMKETLRAARGRHVRRGQGSAPPMLPP